MLCHALRDRSGRQLPCLTPNPDPNYICDFLPSLNYGHRHKRAASFKSGAFKPDDALYAHVASRRCETEAAPTVMPTAMAAAAVIFPCSWFSHVCMTPTAAAPVYKTARPLASEHMQWPIKTNVPRLPARIMNEPWQLWSRGS